MLRLGRLADSSYPSRCYSLIRMKFDSCHCVVIILPVRYLCICILPRNETGLVSATINSPVRIAILGASALRLNDLSIFR